MKIDDLKWQQVVNTLEILREEKDKFSKITENIMVSPESPLIEPMNILEDTIIKNLEFLINDEYKNIDWFVYECDYGRKSMEAGIKGDMRIINTYDNLRWLIELD